MPITESYKDKVFRISDPDARIRVSRNDLQTFAKKGKGFIVIPQGEEVRIREVLIANTGSESSRIFALAYTQNGLELGWTSTRNFVGSFQNETLGVIQPENGASKYSQTAAWSSGKYIGQIELVQIVSTELKVRQIALSAVDAYGSMYSAADIDGVHVTINSGFRSYAEQKALRDGWERKLPGYNRAAKPGGSNHQSGIAFDINVAGGPGNPTYDWLATRGPEFGFFRTVNKEPWHWEYDLVKAAQLIAANTFKTPNVNV